MDDYERDLETCRLHGWMLVELEEARAAHDAWWATRNDPENWQRMWPDRPVPYIICEAELAIPLLNPVYLPAKAPLLGVDRRCQMS